MSMEKIALWPSSSQKVENSTKETCIMPSRGMLSLKISSHWSAYGFTLFIRPIAMNMVGVEETSELESSAENKLCPTFPQ